MVADGTHTLATSATDRATNAATLARVVIVDNTPPDTQVTGGPSGATPDTTATFTFTGTDNLTPIGSLVFAWRLDGGPFSAFSPATTATFTGLAPGPHAFDVKARDLAGNEDPAPAQRTFTVSTLSVTITEPANGATVAAGVLLVRGTVQSNGQEVGVTVNGVVAAVQGTSFAAVLPVSPDTTSLTAVATVPSGATATQTIAVTVTAPGATSALVLLASPASGVAPLTVSFSLFSDSTAARIDLDANGDGVVDFTGTVLDQESFTFTQPGLYVATAAMTDAVGNRTVVATAVEVLDQSALNVLLEAKWADLKDGLRAGNIDKALEVIVLGARADYRDMLTALTPQFGQIDAILTDINAVSFSENRVEYQMIRLDDGVRLSYFVLFARDGDGIWRLKFF